MVNSPKTYLIEAYGQKRGDRVLLGMKSDPTCQNPVASYMLSKDMRSVSILVSAKNAEGYMVMQVKNTGRMGQDQAVLDSAKDVFGESVRKEMQNNGYDKNYEYALETVGDITFFVSFASRETDGKTEHISHCVTIDAATDAIEIITYADKETTLNLLKGFATAV